MIFDDAAAIAAMVAAMETRRDPFGGLIMVLKLLSFIHHGSSWLLAVVHKHSY